MPLTVENARVLILIYWSLLQRVIVVRFVGLCLSANLDR